MMEAASWNSNVFGHGSIDAIAKPEPSWIKVVKALAAHRIIGIDDCGCFADDLISFLPSFDALTCLCDEASELMTKDNGVIDRPTVVGRPLVKITAAYAYRCDF